MTYTPIAILRPNNYVDPEAAPDDIEAWSEEFEWRRDEFAGLVDVLKPVVDTVATARGDCEDYAFVVCSWAIKHDRDVSLGCCWQNVGFGIPWPYPRHFVAVTEYRVYSSGEIHDMSFEEYVEASDYDYGRLRNVSG